MEGKFLHAYTLLEIIVVISVIVVMMGLGITGLVSFKRNAEFNSTYTSLVTNIRSIQNRARNSISEDSGVTPSDYYGIFFSQNEYSSYRCINSGNNLNCSKTVRMFQDTALLNASFTLGECNNVLFQRLTGRIYTVNYESELGEVITTGQPGKIIESCNFTLSGGNGEQREINFNLNTNQVSFE